MYDGICSGGFIISQEIKNNGINRQKNSKTLTTIKHIQDIQLYQRKYMCIIA
jgi:hypothetical protein